MRQPKTAINNVMTLPTSGQITLEMIQGEFGGPIPIVFSNYYNKTINTAIYANIVSYSSERDAFLTSESGQYISNFAAGQNSDGGLNYYTADYGRFAPLDDMSYEFNSGEMVLTTENIITSTVWNGDNTGSYTVGGTVPVNENTTVVRSQGTIWGGIAQPKSWGSVSYFILDPSNTYTLTIRKRIVADDTANNAPQSYGQISVFDSNFIYIGSYTVFYPQVYAANGWVDLTGTFTASDITASFPTGVYGRPFTWDNIYNGVNGVGVPFTTVCNVICETATIAITANTTPPIGGLGITKLYDETNGADLVHVLSGSTWSIDPTQSINDLDGPRQATNFYTGRVYRVGNFYVIDSPENAAIPTSGQLKFSDFYGAEQASGPQYLPLTYNSNPHDFGSFDGNNPMSISITAYSLQNLPIEITIKSPPPYLTITNNTTNTVTISGTTYTAQTVVLSGTSYFVSFLENYPIGFYVSAADSYLTNQVVFQYETVNNPPVWTTASGSLGSYSANAAISITLMGVDPEHTTLDYSMANNTTLPSGLSLSAYGVISGSVSAVGTYNFSINLSDGLYIIPENFSITIT